MADPVAVRLDLRRNLVAAVCSLRLLDGDPAAARVGEFWVRRDLLKLCVMTASGVSRASLA